MSRTQQPMMDTPHEVEIRAEVNVPQSVILYNSDGEQIQVPADRVDYWRRLGFSDQPLDLAALASEVDALGDAIGAPWRAYVEACEQLGAIDPVAQEVAHQSLQQFCDAANRLHLAIHAKYKPLETEQEG